jgi:hypothetical protein
MTSRPIDTAPASATTPAQVGSQAHAHVSQGPESGLPQYPGAFKPLSRTDAADVLGISIRTLENWLNDGRLPKPTSIAGRRYWHPERFYGALEAMMQPEDANSEQSRPVTTPERAKPPKNEESAAGKRAKQAAQEKGEALLRQARAAVAQAE